MISAKCDFCGNSCDTKLNILAIVPITESPDAETVLKMPKELHICDTCLQLHILSKLDKNKQKETIEPAEPEFDFTGMELKDFLSTPMYLQTQNIIFQQLNGDIIRDFNPWIHRHIIYVGEPNPITGEILVTLN